MNGSDNLFLSGSPAAGYVVITVLALLLGVCVTLLAMHVRKIQHKEHNDS